MKKMVKKIIAVGVSSVMMLAMSVSVFAAGTIDANEQAVLAGKVVVQRGLGDASPLRHILHGGLVIARGAEQLARGLENALPALELIQFPSALFHHIAHSL